MAKIFSLLCVVLLFLSCENDKKAAENGLEGLKNFFIPLSATDRKRIEAYKNECKDNLDIEVVVENNAATIQHPLDGELEFDTVDEAVQFLKDEIEAFTEDGDDTSLEQIKNENKSLLDKE